MSFLSLEIGMSALRTQQLAIERTNHNVTNAQVEGYSRQVLDTSAQVISNIGAYDSRLFTMGNGVKVNEIKRYREEYHNQFYRAEKSKLGTQDIKEQYFTQLNTVFGSDLANTDTDTGLRQKLSNFFNAFSDLANDPTDLSRRTAVVDEGKDITEYFHNTKNSIDELKTRVNGDLTTALEDINKYAKQIAYLNSKIVSSSAKTDGGNADLLDERDRYLDKLAEIVDFKTSFNSANGSVTIGIGSTLLVADNNSYNLTMDSNGNIRGFDNRVIYGQDDTGKKVRNLSDGKLVGLMEFRDEILGEAETKLDDQARALMETVNQIHKNGYDLKGNTGILFFKNLEDTSKIPPVTNNAGNISLSDDLLNDPSKISGAVAKLSSTTQVSQPNQSINTGLSLASQPFLTAPSASGNIQLSYYVLDEHSNNYVLYQKNISWTNTQTLEEIMGNINSESSKTGVIASFDAATQKLMLTRDTTIGEGSSITVGAPVAPPPPPASVYIQDVAIPPGAAGNFTAFTNLSTATSVNSSGDNTNITKLSEVASEKLKIGSSSFTREQIIDWRGFMSGLQGGGPPGDADGTITERIYFSLDATSQAIIDAWDPITNPLDDVSKDTIIAGLNNVLDDRRLYSGTTPPGTNLTFTDTDQERTELINKGISDLPRRDIQRLNRLIFQSSGAFPSEIEKSTSEDSTLQEAYTNMLTDFGTEANTTAEFVEVYTLSTEEALSVRNEVSGVSLDEEFTNLIKFQKAYQAAAKLINVSNEILDTIINGLGI